MGEQQRRACSSRKQAIRRKAQQCHSHFYERVAHWSFCPHGEASPLHWHRERWLLGGTTLLLTALSALILPAWAGALQFDRLVSPRTLPLPPATLVIAPDANLPSVMPAPVVEHWQKAEVQPGQTLSDIFQAQGYSLADLQQVMDAAGNSKTLHHISPGQSFEFLSAEDSGLAGFRYDDGAASRTTIRFDHGVAKLSQQALAMDERETIAHGTIEDSLFGAGSKAGLSSTMVLKLANLFQYDIDFAQDLRQGDHFTVIYDKVYRDGHFSHDGDIVAAEFYNDGTRYTAYRYQAPGGEVRWYSEDGRPLQKAFLRTPVDFTRISSTFSAARFHPILGRMRAHKGVDYAAPTGTPIHAAGDGVIKYRGWMNGYGNFVLIDHNGTISTAYGHMSRFARNERVGSHVRQGQVIGYVGMTGLATGPHLHYEFRVNGAQRNPLTVTLPKSQPLPAAQLAAFRSHVVRPQLARLEAADTPLKLARGPGPAPADVQAGTDSEARVGDASHAASFD
ncbi:OapA family protein [Frateuria aurantia]